MPLRRARRCAMPDVVEILFWGAIVGGAAGEVVWAFRALKADCGRRWLANLGLGALALFLGRWLVPLGAAFTAAFADFGLLHLAGDSVLAVIAGLLLLDLLNYGLHRLSHRVPLLWRLHRVHHSDLDVDFSTAFRHHPLETILTTFVIAGGIVLLGIPPGAVALYQLGRVVVDVASHMNVHLQERYDRLLRLIVITPDMHRIHHSARRAETDSNYTTLLSLWDHLFGSYTAVPQDDPRTMPLGLESWRDERRLALPHLLLQPFTTPPQTLPPPAPAVAGPASKAGRL